MPSTMISMLTPEDKVEYVSHSDEGHEQETCKKDQKKTEPTDPRTPGKNRGPSLSTRFYS